ncbi:MAG TPA: SUMF1/EgtB/PvdO family nonheme iron enzyme [Candidatus Limnocylindria bacterium]
MSTVRAVVEPDVVVVPAGDALLGDPPRTEHVNVFAIARRPVSAAEYAVYLAEDRHEPSRSSSSPDRPVDGVTWADAVAYCRWLTLGTGRIYRLPDEREWEKAARSAGMLEPSGDLREWTNSWQDGGRVLRSAAEPAKRFFAADGSGPIGFRVVRGMTGR